MFFLAEARVPMRAPEPWSIMARPTSSKQRERDAYLAMGKTGDPAAGAGPQAPGDWPSLTPTKAERRRFLRRYAGFLRPFLWQIGSILTLALVVAALDLIWPLLIMLLIDVATGSKVSTAGAQHRALQRLPW